MIKSIINGEAIGGSYFQTVKDIHGNTMDTACLFDEDLQHFSSQLKNVFYAWKNTPLEKRLDAVLSIKQNLEDQAIAESIIESICAEIGKPRIEAETEISESIGFIDYYLDNVSEDMFVYDIEIDPYYQTKKNILKYEPLGIVGIIKPWNYPVSNSLWSIIPALISGNLVVYKPSEHCWHTAMLLTNAIIHSRLPKGVFNTIIGDYRAGQRITECRDIAMISFTGSTDVAIKIQQQALNCGVLRKYSVESGGSDFAIIDKDVNLDFAAEGIVWGAFNNSGQVCTSIENVIVPASCYDEFLKLLIEKTKKLTAGNDYGPIQNSALFEKTKRYLSSIEADDSMVVVEGGVIYNGYLSPTIIKCANIESANSELFSNILRVFSYNENTDLLGELNSLNYGLGCSIWTSSPNDDRIQRLIYGMEVGMIWVNDVNISFPEMPWTGRKNSGFGFNMSLDALKEFSQIKCISIDNNTEDYKDWWFPYEHN